MANNSVLFIPISFMSFGDFEISRLGSMSSRYYKFIVNKKEIYGYSLEKGMLSKLPVIGSGADLLLNIIETNLKFELKKNQNYSIKEAEDVALSRYNSLHYRMIDNLKAYEYNIKLLVEIINISRKNSVRPILVTTPMYISLLNKFTATQIQRFYSAINQVIESTGVVYFDYSNSILFKNDLDMFIDTDHLSEKGREKFTKKILVYCLINNVTNHQL
jgi:hypothetical protein